MRFVPPLDPDEAAKRTLLITPALENTLFAPRNTRAMDDYFSRVRAALGEYVKGAVIKDDENTFKRLMPDTDAVWEMKITFNPHARLLGGFAMFDVFVALDWKFRRDLDQPGSWPEAISRAKNQWKSKLKPERRLKSWPLSQCISNVR